MRRDLATTFLCVLFASAAPGAEQPTLPAANTWLRVGGDDSRFEDLRRELEMLNGSAKGQYDNWIFQHKRGTYSSALRGVWLPDAKRALFLACGIDQTVRTFLYDPATGGAWTEKLGPKDKPRGWTDAKAGGDPIQGALRWAALCYDPVNKEVLLFGGNCASPEGTPGTMTYAVAGNAWTRRAYADLPLFKPHAECEALRQAAFALAGRLRARLNLAETPGETKEDLAKSGADLAAKIQSFAAGLPESGAQEKEQVGWARPALARAAEVLKGIGAETSPKAIAAAEAAAEALREAREALAVEPPARANAPLAYDDVNKQIVLYGGDHLDYLMSDTWVYDCAARRWRQRRPERAPAPRGGHALLNLPGKGKVALLGGYAYGSEEGYGARDYLYRDFELWTYDVKENRWALVGCWKQKEHEIAEGVIGFMENAPSMPRTDALQAVGDAAGRVACLSVERRNEGKKGWWDEAMYVCAVDPAREDAAGAAQRAVAPGTIATRTGKYLPGWFDDTPAPDAQATEAALAVLPANAWVRMQPPKVLERNRDWGTATFDTDRQQILFFSGGHCAYSGTDVSIYSTRTNRWRNSALAEMPIEFCRGTGYHAQAWSFTQRPFMTSHTYRMYAYDPILKKMVLANRSHTHVFDPLTGEWERAPKPAPFQIGFNPKLVTTPEGVMAWANPNRGSKVRSFASGEGSLYRYDKGADDWVAIATKAGVPGVPFADLGTLVYDSKRARLLLFATENRTAKTSVWSCDPKSGAFEKIDVANGEHGVEYPRESVYLPDADLVLFADARGKAADGSVVAASYDVEGKRFRGVTLGLPKDSNRKKGAYGGVGCGLMYDAGRKLAWIVYYDWQIWALRFDAASATFTD